MLTRNLSALLAVALTVAACSSTKKSDIAAEAPKPVVVNTATAFSREVPADFQETGTFAADESSDIAPPVAGRVI